MICGISSDIEGTSQCGESYSPSSINEGQGVLNTPHLGKMINAQIHDDADNDDDDDDDDDSDNDDEDEDEGEGEDEEDVDPMVMFVRGW